MRSNAFRDADLIIIFDRRTNYVIGHAAPPRFSAGAKIAHFEIDHRSWACRRATSTSRSSATGNRCCSNCARVDA
jgi:hypothetical protein